jgi:hypothetical protein
MKVFQSMKAMLLSIGLAIGVGTIGFAMFANAQSVQSSPTASQSTQKETDKETNDDTTSATDNQQDGETNDDATVTKSPTTN